MSRRTIAQAERILTDVRDDKTGRTETVAVYHRTTIDHPQRDRYFLYAQDGDTVKEIMPLSGRFGRAIRRGYREGRFYPNAFIAHGKDGSKYPRFYIRDGVVSHIRGQEDARRAVIAPQAVDWDSKNTAGETFGEVVVDIIRMRLARGL